MKKIDYKKFIEDNFSIIDKSGQVVPFHFNSVQDKYYQELATDYPDFQGVREWILKARQEGISSLILSLFATDFLMQNDPVSSICISHRQDATQKLFGKVKFFIQSACNKLGVEEKTILEQDSSNQIRNRQNGAVFWIGTSGSKVGGRGATVQNIHFSETAFYPNTPILSAEEIITSTLQMVELNKGKVFSESTGNGYGNYYQLEWERASRGESTFKPRFFSWKGFYSDEFITEKKKEFQDEATFRQEYPSTPEEAFISSGHPFFDMEALKLYQKEKVKEPIKTGFLASDGGFV